MHVYLYNAGFNDHTHDIRAYRHKHNDGRMYKLYIICTDLSKNKRFHAYSYFYCLIVQLIPLIISIVSERMHAYNTVVAYR